MVTAFTTAPWITLRGCAILLEMARDWAALPDKPRRSAIFLSVTAEEGGLRGSEYYGLHPFFPASKTALNLNFDGFEPLGRTKDISVTGAERITIWPTVQSVAKRFNFEIKPDPRPEQGSYFRSDHFSMVRAGIPAFSVDQGNEYWGKPAGFGDQAFEEFNSKHYHQPSDEYRADWDFSGLEQIARFGFTLGMEVANQQKLPDWFPGDRVQAPVGASALSVKSSYNRGDPNAASEIPSVSVLALTILSVTLAAAQTTQQRREPEVPYVPTTDEAVEAMLKLAGVKKADLVYDLGCGDGRIVIAAAKTYGCSWRSRNPSRSRPYR